MKVRARAISMENDSGNQMKSLNGFSDKAGALTRDPVFELQMVTEAGVRKLCVTIRHVRQRPQEQKLYYAVDKIDDVMKMIGCRLAMVGDPAVAARLAADDDKATKEEGFRDIRENGGVSLGGLIQQLEQEAYQP
jgi:hypothetical protein